MDSITEKYMLLVEKISYTSKAAKPFDTDVNIYRGEIHIIQLIGDRGEVYVTEISRLLGVTKGTVSQIVKRLETKGLVEKRVDEKNNTRLLVYLSAKGKIAYRSHLAYHQEKHQEMELFLRSLTTGEKKVIQDFLDLAYDMIEDHM